MNYNNTLTQLLQIEYPIVQAPMLGVTTPEMVAAISNQGGLGSLPVGGLSAEKTLELIKKTKTLTSNLFAVNLFVHSITKFNKEQGQAMLSFLERFCADNGLPFSAEVLETARLYSYKEQIEILLNERIPVVSFTFGIPDLESIKRLKEIGTILIGTATSAKEAIALDEKGIDIITAQGIEAGGHRGTFLEDEPLPLIGLMSLVTQITSKVQRPVLAAGGICNGKTIKAALALGAMGAQVGSLFIASDESAAIPSYKEAVQNARETDTVLTRAISGRWARGIRNQFITAVEKSGIEIPEYTIQSTLTARLRTAAQQANNKEFTSLWAGQTACKAQAKPTAEIFTDLIRQLKELE